MANKHLMMNCLLEKLIGASFSISIFFIIMITYSEFNLVVFQGVITTPAIWFLFFGYGIMSSIVIDFIRKFINIQILLYFLFGYLIFLIFMPLVYALIAGTVGACFSLLFWLGKEKLKPSKWYNWIVCVVPFICIVMIPFDFTSKVGWNEMVGDSFVEVEYEYFNGEHLIPIHGDQGEQIYFNVEHHVGHGNSHGISLYDENGEHAGMNEEKGDVLSVEFEKATTKHIVVRAINGNRGQFQVKWWKEGQAGSYR